MTQENLNPDGSVIIKSIEEKKPTMEETREFLGLPPIEEEVLCPICNNDVSKHMNVGYQCPKPIEQKVDVSELKTKIFEALGGASMCWNPEPSSQVFDDAKAIKIGNELLEYILSIKK